MRWGLSPETKAAKLVVWGFVLAGLVMLAAALLPALKGGEVNGAFLAIGMLWLILALAIRKKKSTG